MFRATHRPSSGAQKLDKLFEDILLSVIITPFLLSESLLLIEHETSFQILELLPLDAYQERLNVEFGYNRIRKKSI
jgi:hypothetical protein